MKTRSIAAGVLALSLFAGAANAMTVQEFLTTANAIPQNPTALLRSDTRRLMAEFRGAVRTIRAEQTQAKAAGRQPATCMPDKVSVSPNAILSRFNAIPQSRRNISVTQAFREWMAHDYPCA
ncbi:hypothetical protein [Brevundimonas sp.]|uniref:hypothetical protein n=1 Tax=Brevundimonas sp. TaxID=1871086 RepID=UPI0028B04049|nr:hypothetical protein [Brevundimonas sp.]